MNPGWMKGLLAAASLTLVAGGGCGGGDLPSRKDLNVLFITLDTTRRDHLGCYGWNVETPTLDGLASDGVLFTGAVSPVPLTCPSHSTMFTGLFPPNHGVRSNGGFHLSPDRTTLAEILQENGYRTGGFTAAYVLNRVFGLDQGFDHYDDDLRGGQESVQEGMFTARERRADAVIASALAWLNEAPKEKFFLWTHFYDAHMPYQPPAPFNGMYPYDPYTGEIAYLDHQIGGMLDSLRALGVLDNTLIIAVGDHGESLYQHGESAHAYFVYDSSLLVPLIIHTPRLSDLDIPSGQRLDGQVRLVDLMPTILSILEIPPPEGIQGLTLLPYMAQKQNVPDRDNYCETQLPMLDYGWSDLIGIRTGRWKYIDAPERELYDLERDPWEIDNLAQTYPDRVEEMRGRIAAILAGESGGPAETWSTMEMDDEMRASLQSLGYLGGSEETQPERPTLDSLGLREPTGRDPKEMIHVFEPITRAMTAMFRGDTEEALRFLSKATSIEPNNKQANRFMGDCYKLLNLPGKAEEHYKLVLKYDPNRPEVLNNLGALYSDLGRYKEALPLLERAIAARPSLTDAHNNLGVLHLAQGDIDAAIPFFRKAIELDSGMAEAHFNLANCLGRKEEWEEAADQMEIVLEINPRYPEAKRYLDYARQQAAMEKRGEGT